MPLWCRRTGWWSPYPGLVSALALVFCYNRIVSSQAVDITSKRNIVPSYKAFLAVRIDFIKAMSELTSPCIKYLFFRWQVAS